MNTLHISNLKRGYIVLDLQIFLFLFLVLFLALQKSESVLGD